MKHFNKLRFFRQRSGLTQYDLAKIIGTSQSRVWYWENEFGIVPPKYANRIATALNTIPESIFDNSGKVLPLVFDKFGNDLPLIN